jgi:hypothetical protein
MTRILFAALAGTLAVPAAAAPFDDAAATVDAFHAALKSGNSAAATALLADQALIFESGGVERSKAEYVKSHLLADIEFSKLVPLEIIRRHGVADNGWAWVATEGRMRGSWKGKPVDRLSTETMLLHADEGSWKIVHVHWSSAAAH